MTHLRTEIEVVDLDIARADLGVDLGVVELSWFQKISQCLLQHKRKEAALDVGWNGKVERRQTWDPRREPRHNGGPKQSCVLQMYAWIVVDTGSV